MTGVTYTPLFCSACGKIVGTQKGVGVVNGLLCSDPICNFQEEFTLNEARDALIVAAALERIPIVQIAFATDMSRQRVYQIIDTWKQGV